MKKVIYCCIVATLGLSDESILSELKKENLKLKEQSVQKSSDVLENSWINPLTLSIGANKDQITSKLGSQRSISARLGFNQDIYRSGGIFHAIDYAKATRILGLSQIKSEKNANIFTAYSMLLKILKNDILQAQQKLSIENSNLEIKRKKEQYQGGLIDISFLNNAILQKMAQENGLIKLQEAKQTLILEFEKISDKEYKTIKIPQIKIPSQTNYISQNLALMVQKNSINAKEYYAKLVKSKYLPKVSLNANYTLSDIKNRQIDTSDNYYGYGITASMPFDIKRGDDIEKSRLDFMIAKNELSILEDTQEKEYRKILADLKKIDKKIKLAQDNIKIYDSLLAQTKDLVQAGIQIEDDLTIMENSKQVRVFEEKIYTLEKEEKKLEFYKELAVSF